MFILHCICIELILYSTIKHSECREAVHSERAAQRFHGSEQRLGGLQVIAEEIKEKVRPSFPIFICLLICI